MFLCLLSFVFLGGLLGWVNGLVALVVICSLILGGGFHFVMGLIVAPDLMLIFGNVMDCFLGSSPGVRALFTFSFG